MVFVTGEAGIGKTMFIEPFLQRLMPRVEGQEEHQKVKLIDLRSLTADPQAETEACFLKAFAIAHQQGEKFM